MRRLAAVPEAGRPGRQQYVRLRSSRAWQVAGGPDPLRAFQHDQRPIVGRTGAGSVYPSACPGRSSCRLTRARVRSVYGVSLERSSG